MSFYRFLLQVFYRLLQWGLHLIDSFRQNICTINPAIGQPIDCVHQYEFVNKTSTCSIIRSKYNAVMSYYEVIIRMAGNFFYFSARDLKFCSHKVHYIHD